WRLSQPQFAVVVVNIYNVYDGTDSIGNSSQSKADRKTQGFLHKAHKQRTDTNAHIIREHISGVDHTPLGCGGGAGDKGLEQRLQNSVPQPEKEAGGQQMYAGRQEQIADHCQNQNYQAEIDEYPMMTGIDHLLREQLGNQHP